MSHCCTVSVCSAMSVQDAETEDEDEWIKWSDGLTRDLTGKRGDDGEVAEDVHGEGESPKTREHVQEEGGVLHGTTREDKSRRNDDYEADDESEESDGSEEDGSEADEPEDRSEEDGSEEDGSKEDGLEEDGSEEDEREEDEEGETCCRGTKRKCQSKEDVND